MKNLFGVPPSSLYGDDLKEQPDENAIGYRSGTMHDCVRKPLTSTATFIGPSVRGDHGFNVPGKNEWYTTHGDVFPIHGATMKPFGRHNGMRSFPSVERSKGSPQWNHYRIVCTNGVIRLHVNGREVSGGEECNYRKGYLGLESEGAPIEFRNLRLKELPSSGAPEECSAPVDMGWRSLFTGLDLRGWQRGGVRRCAAHRYDLAVRL